MATLMVPIQVTHKHTVTRMLVNILRTLTTHTHTHTHTHTVQRHTHCSDSFKVLIQAAGAQFGA